MTCQVCGAQMTEIVVFTSVEMECKVCKFLNETQKSTTLKKCAEKHSSGVIDLSIVEILHWHECLKRAAEIEYKAGRYTGASFWELFVCAGARKVLGLE